MNKTLYHAVAHTPEQHRAGVYALATLPPVDWPHRLRWGLAIVAALLLGAGLIFWVAANWAQQTRGFKLMLIQGAFGASGLLAFLVSKVRIAALVATSLCLGGWLAFIGQSYQTGADAWQLFAVWAALSLTWTWPQRSDLLWSLWLLIAGLALALWIGQGLDDLAFSTLPLSSVLFHLSLWALLPVAMLLVGITPCMRLAEGLPRQAWRLAIGLSTVAWCSYCVLGWWSDGRISLLALAWLLMFGALAWQSRWRDFVALVVVVVALNVGVLSAAARWLFGVDAEWLLSTLGLTALSLIALGISARWLLAQQVAWEGVSDAIQ